MGTAITKYFLPKLGAILFLTLTTTQVSADQSLSKTIFFNSAFYQKNLYEILRKDLPDHECLQLNLPADECWGEDRLKELWTLMEEGRFPVYGPTVTFSVQESQNVDIFVADRKISNGAYSKNEKVASVSQRRFSQIVEFFRKTPPTLPGKYDFNGTHGQEYLGVGAIIGGIIGAEHKAAPMKGVLIGTVIGGAAWILWGVARDTLRAPRTYFPQNALNTLSYQLANPTAAEKPNKLYPLIEEEYKLIEKNFVNRIVNDKAQYQNRKK